MAKIYIGTSGWHYSHWKGPFYPKDLTDKQLLFFYIKHFSTVEINRTFYSLPKKEVFTTYAKAVPKDFVFSVKASRFITHIKRLKDPKAPLKNFFTAVKGLKKHLGPILFQLPPRFKSNPERLEAFLKALPKNHRYTFEFRDPSWLNPTIYALLKKYNAAFCIYEFDHLQTPMIITADFTYIRLHGPKGAYQGNYPTSTLKKWARVILTEKKKGRDVFIYFDNDEAGYAPKNARALKAFLML